MTSFLVASLARSASTWRSAGVGPRLGLPLKGGRSVFEELLLPQVELGRLDVVPVAEIGDRHPIDHVLFHDGHFLCGLKCLRSREFDPFLAGSMESSFASRYANARERKFQFRLRQDKSHSFFTTWITIRASFGK